MSLRFLNSSEFAITNAGAKYTKELPWTSGSREPKKVWSIVVRPETNNMVETTVAVSSCHIKRSYYLNAVLMQIRANEQWRKERVIHQIHPLLVPVSKEQKQVNQLLTDNVVCHKIQGVLQLKNRIMSRVIPAVIIGLTSKFSNTESTCQIWTIIFPTSIKHEI